MMWILAVRAIVGVVLLKLAALGAGSWIARAAPASVGRVERAALALLGGLGILGFVWFVIGQFWFTPIFIWAVTGLAIVIFFRPILRLLRDAANFLSEISSAELLPAAIVAIVLSVVAVSGLAELTGDWGIDGVSYHMLGPKVWLREGVIRPVLDHSHTAFPQIPETLFAALLTMGGNRAPDFCSFLFLGLLLCVASGIGIRLGLEKTFVWWIAALVAAMPAVLSGSHHCFVDGIYAAFVLAAVRIGLDAESLKEWAAFGLFCGLALGTKYTGVLACAGLAVCCVIMLLLRGSWKPGYFLRAFATSGVVAAVVALPFYLRNEIFLGCPIYPPPPGYALFCHPRHFPAAGIAEFHAYIRHRGEGLGRGLWAFLLLPYNLTYHTSNFHGAGGIGLCPLGLAPMGWIALRRERFAQLIAMFAALQTCMWFVTQQESRFLIPTYAIAAIFAAAGWRYVRANGNAVTRVLGMLLVAFSIGYGLFMFAREEQPRILAVLSPDRAEARREAEIPFLAGFEYLNSCADVTKVLLPDHLITPYYLNKSYLKPVGPWGETTIDDVPSSEQALERARELGISHVFDVVTPDFGFRVKEGTPGLTLVFEGKDQRIYRVDR